MDRPRSLEAFERARAVIPGGVNSPARAFGGVGGNPIFIARAEGPYLYDLDGHRYVDFVGSWGPMILGHCHPAVVAAVQQAIARGSSYGAPCQLETDLAELVIEAVPSIAMVRFVSSGTEAAMSAIRLARGFTGRNKIIKFAGCYHGHVDSLLVAAGSSATTLGVPTSPGVPRGCTTDTIVLPYNDPQRLIETFREQGDSIAGVIVEPVAGNMGVVVASSDFRHELRNCTQKHGALLIYDEVMTGFRLAYGGAQELFGDNPDLTILGKILGGGYPVGAFGGRRDVMQQIMPSGPVFQAGTLSGNPVAMAAGIATLTELKKHPPYESFELTQRKLQQAFATSFSSSQSRPVTLNALGSMWTLFFSKQPVTDYDSARGSDAKSYSQFFWHMMDQGYYLPCSQYEAAFFMTAMSESMIDVFIQKAKQYIAS